MCVGLTRILASIGLLTSIVCSIPLGAGVRHPKGPDKKEWLDYRLQIHGFEKPLSISFSAPKGNDPELKDTWVTEASIEDPRFEPGGPGAFVHLHWAWGHDWFWQDYSGFLGMAIRVDRWEDETNAGDAVAFSRFISKKMDLEAQQKSLAAKVDGSINNKYVGLPIFLTIDGKPWVYYKIQGGNAVTGCPNERYVLPLDHQHYLLVAFNYIDQTSLSGESNDWSMRAKALADKIMASIQIR